MRRNPNYNSEAYGKGVLYLNYSRQTCGYLLVPYQIYKTFDPPYGIAGPGCVVAGDTVVYSVEPSLTVNPNAYIGTDGYKWDFSHFDADVLYYSGDSSAVTLEINSVHDGDYIGLHIGQANFGDPDKQVKLELSRRAPMPEVEGELCVPAATQTDVQYVTLNVINAVDSVYYLWELPSHFVKVTEDSDTVRGTSVRLKLIDGQPGDITVRASYSNDTENEADCSVSEANVHIDRSFGSKSAINGNSCVVADADFYEYSLVDVPSSSNFVWILPEGWQWDGNKVSNAATISIRPSSINAELTGTLRVTLDPCNSDTLELAINVRPGNVTILGDECIERGEVLTYSVANGKPAAAGYEWTFPAGWVQQSAEGTTVTVKASAGNAGIITVMPLGINGCNGNVAELETQFRPTAPTDINVPDDCINSGMPDTIFISVVGLSDQKYLWDIGELGNIINDPDSTVIQVKTSGIDGVYPISVIALGGDGSCGNSATVTDTVTIVGEDIPDPDIYQIRRNIAFDFFEIIDMDYSYLWLLDDVDITNYNFGADETYWVEIPLLTLAVSNTLSVTITNNETGCTLRKYFDLSPYHTQSKSLKSGNVSVDVPLRNLSQFDFTVSPNPADATVNVAFTGSGTGTVSLSLYDVSGVLVNTWNNVTTPSVSLDISAIKSGNYILLADQNNNYSTKRLVVK